MDLCSVFSQFSPVSPSSFNFSNDSILTGGLPDPNLFFTWYCEKAREIEKYSGSIEFGVKLLDLALNNLSPSSRIAKRFILATRNSLIRYNLHINSLAKSLEDENILFQEKADILQTLRSLDLKSFETSGHLKTQKLTTDSNDLPSHDFEDDVTVYTSAFVDFSTEILTLDLIIQQKFSEAYDQVQENIFFPAALLDANNIDPISWLKNYCKSLIKECSVYFDERKDDDNLVFPVVPELCEDPLSRTIHEFLQDNHSEERSMSLLMAKSKMALSILNSKNTAENDNDDLFF